MNLKFYPFQKLKKQILEIISKHLNLDSYRVFFFGSRVSGRSDEFSDIDIGIEGSKSVSLNVFSNIKEELDKIKTLYTLELVDFRRVPPDFYKVAKQFIEPLN